MVEETPLDVLVEDTFRIRDRGLVVTGVLRGGVLRVGESVEVVNPDGASAVAMVRGIEFACGPNVRRDIIGFMLGVEAEPFLVAGTVVRGVIGPAAE